MRIALAQIAPVVLDRDATIAKVVRAIHAAADRGCRLCAFAEALVPAYPVWLSRTDAARFDEPDIKRLHAEYIDQAVDIDPRTLESPHLQPICAAAAARGVSVVIGVIERAADRGRHSLYCARVFIEGRGPSAGRILSVHRKLMPTYEERLSWSPGDGAGLVVHAVDEFTVASLNCWENWMPLARAAIYAQGANLIIPLWPGSDRNTRDITRFIALEARAFVASASALMRSSDIPPHLPSRDAWAGVDELINNGGSGIAAPDGSWLVPPVVDREDILTADLDLRRVLEERQNFDPSGHYARPDVLSLTVDRRRQSAARFLDD